MYTLVCYYDYEAKTNFERNNITQQQQQQRGRTSTRIRQYVIRSSSNNRCNEQLIPINKPTLFHVFVFT